MQTRPASRQPVRARDRKAIRRRRNNRCDAESNLAVGRRRISTPPFAAVRQARGTRVCQVWHHARIPSISLPSFFGVSRGPPMQATGRMFLCARCRAQVFICRRCDRGQRYCTVQCARISRRENQREAGRRYQRTRRGRFAHAARARRHRVRQQIVTHQGSPARPANVVLQAPPNDVAVAPVNVAAQTATSGVLHCRRCGGLLSPFVRTGFVRRRGWGIRPSSDSGDSP